MNNKIISFPHLGPYYIPIKYIIENITKLPVLVPPYNNQQTISLGAANSPDDICMPFKYNLGNYINALNAGATILIQAGGGCRYGYFAELQEAILKNLGYKFEFVNLIKDNHVSLTKLYKFAKKYNKKLNYITYFYYLIQGFLIIIFLDKLNKYQRINMGISTNIKLFETKEKQMLNAFSIKKLSIIKIIKIYHKYKKAYQSIPLKNDKHIKILLIGELYSLMDLASSNNLERNLMKQGISIYRYTDLTYLLITKRFKRHSLLKRGKKYAKYTLGADGLESVVHAKEHSSSNIDGIIHIKSFSCVPENNAIPILNQISEDYNVPILYLSFDGENNIANIDTKLEAFYDMLEAKKNKTIHL